MNNILKYADCSNVTLTIQYHNGSIKMFVEDDGKGFNSEKIKKGRGLRSMKARAQNINGDITVSSNNGRGTIVEFTGALA